MEMNPKFIIFNVDVSDRTITNVNLSVINRFMAMRSGIVIAYSVKEGMFRVLKNRYSPFRHTGQLEDMGNYLMKFISEGYYNVE